MLEFYNVKVYDLEECVIACRNAMRTKMPEYTKEEFEKSLERAKKLVSATKESKDVKCHDNFLTGIRVAFDMKYTQYITKQFQRYHWFDYVSSNSLMHRLTMMKVDENCAKYVTRDAVGNLQREVDLYNAMEKGKISEWVFRLRSGEVIEAYTLADCLYHQYMVCIQNCPMGYELFVRVDTNYKQLQTIYAQRKSHKLKEDYKAFREMVESLPYAKDFII